MIFRPRYLVIAPLLLAYSLVFGEFFIRLMKPSPLLPRYVTAAPYGVRMNIPGAHYWQTTSEVRVHVRINQNGMRSDREIFKRKPEGTCRIVLYGDSFFMGYEVSLEDAFATLLEASLREAGTPCEVVNLAVSGFGTAEMLVALRADGLLYDPDLVIFQWHRTDPADNRRAGLFGIRDGRLVPIGTEYLPAIAARDYLLKFRLYRWAIENSHLYTSLREVVAGRLKQLLLAAQLRGRVAPPREVPSLPTQRREGLDELLLRQAKAESEVSGARFLVVDTPSRKSRTEFSSSAAMLADTLSEDVDIVSSLAAFHQAAHPDRKLFWESGHGHLSVFGNRVLSEVVATHIRERGLLPRD